MRSHYQRYAVCFNYDAAVSTHTQREMEQGIRTDYNSKEDKRKNIQNTETAPNIKYKHDLHVVHQLACLGCTIIGLSCWNYNKYDRVQRHCIKLAYCLRNQHLPPEKHPRITATPW